MAEIHYFDIRIAKLYGINCAVILQNIWHWIRKNEANGTNFYDGTYWTYNSTKAFAELFPYLSQKQIETALKKLRDEEIIITGNYNAVKYDRTLWYAITEKGKCILLSGEMDFPKSGKGSSAEVEPIPNINADSKPTDSKPYTIIVDYLNQRAGTSYRSSSKATQKHINARLAEGYTVEDFMTVIDKKVKEWLGTEFETYLRPETLFGTKFENYLNGKERIRRSGTGNHNNGNVYTLRNGQTTNNPFLADLDKTNDDDLPFTF